MCLREVHGHDIRVSRARFGASVYDVQIFLSFPQGSCSLALKLKRCIVRSLDALFGSACEETRVISPLFNIL